MQMRGRAFEERGLVGVGPNLLGARAAIESTAMGAWIGGDEPAIKASSAAPGSATLYSCWRLKNAQTKAVTSHPSRP